MGLDITAYKQLSAVLDAKLDEDGNPVDYENHWLPGASMEWSEGAFLGRGQGVDTRTVYSFADAFDFRAGSYGGYNQWRDMLAVFAGYPSAKHVYENSPRGPFMELINFADNEGVIGPVVSAKLAKDFTDHLERATEYAAASKNRAWWLEKYMDWKKAFEFAADGGAVDFH